MFIHPEMKSGTDVSDGDDFVHSPAIPTPWPASETGGIFISSCSSWPVAKAFLRAVANPAAFHRFQSRSG